MNPEIQDFEISKDVFFAESVLAAQQAWKTSIVNLQLTGIGSLKCHVERPDSGSARGGYLMIYENDISQHQQPIQRIYYSGQGDFIGEISNDLINFQRGNYTLAYAPHYLDNILLVASSVKILFGSPFDFQLSACQGISRSATDVTSYFKFDSNPLGFGHYSAWIIVREGDVLGEGVQVGIKDLDTSGPAEGIITIPTSRLQRGKTYNVSTTLYSSVRPVAGYTFTVPK